MALTNIIKEPRREITESTIGIVLAAAVAAAVYQPGYTAATWFNNMVDTPNFFWLYVVVGMLITFLLGWLALQLTHVAGESFCDNMTARGVELRGKRRVR